MNDVINNLSFKTLTYHKNRDLMVNYDCAVTMHEGFVSVLRFLDRKMPLIIGEYNFMIIHLDYLRLIDGDLNDLVKISVDDVSYNELNNIIKSKSLDYLDSKYDKILVINTLILKKEYRKVGVSEEFIEMLFRNYYNEKTLIYGLFMPMQNNRTDAELFLKERVVRIKNKSGNDSSYDIVPAADYYSLHDILNMKPDDEYNELKVFSIATRLGFSRLSDDSYLFEFKPNKTIQRIVSRRI